MGRRLGRFLLGLLLALASFSPPLSRGPRPPDGVSPDDGPRPPVDDQVLNAALTAEDPQAMAAFLRRITPPESERQAMARLARELGADSFDTREQAGEALRSRGRDAAAFLARVAHGPGPEAARRAQALLRALPEGRSVGVMTAAVRIAARGTPAEAAGALLGYAPFADEPVLDELRQALIGLASSPEASALLLRALEDADPVRRGLAAEVLAPVADSRPRLRPLLSDADPIARLPAARALLAQREREAVPALISLLPDLSEDERLAVEESLRRLDDQAPATPRDDVRRGQQLWSAWWKTRGDSLDLTRAEAPRFLGQTLVVRIENGSLRGDVAALGSDGAPLWRLSGIDYPISAQLLAGGERVLIAQYAPGRVSERRTTGEVIWERSLDRYVVAAQRLDDGRTFLACRDRLLEIGADGEPVVVHLRGVRDIVGARKASNGDIVLLTHDAVCRRLDEHGKERTHFTVGGPLVMGTHFDLLPGRRVLVPEFGRDRVAEYDAAGRLLWQAAVTAPTGAQRLPNGHTLVVSTPRSALIELDRAGQVVKQSTLTLGPVQATRY